MNFFIEPYIFAITPKQTEQETFENYIKTLLDLEDFSQLSWGNIFLLSTTCDILIYNDFYPFLPKIKELIKKYNISHIGSNDVDRIMNQFLMKFPIVEDLIDLTCEYKNGSARFRLPNRPIIFNQELCKLAGLVSLRNKINSIRDDCNIIFTRDLYGNLEFESTFDILRGDTIKTESFESVFSCYNSIYSFFNNTNSPVIIWKNAIVKRDFEMAIRISILQECQYNCIKNAFDNHIFYLQDSFCECIKELHFQDNDSKISSSIRALKEVLLDKNKAEVHALRVNSGANSAQQCCNGYKAWRKDIDYEHHLHYWHCNKEIKFANVFAHSTYIITKEFN